MLLLRGSLGNSLRESEQETGNSQIILLVPRQEPRKQFNREQGTVEWLLKNRFVDLFCSLPFPIPHYLSRSGKQS